MSKSLIRKSIFTQISQKKYYLSDEIIINSILEIVSKNPLIKNIGLYYPLKGEVNILSLIAKLPLSFSLPIIKDSCIEYTEITKYTKFNFTDSKMLPSPEALNIIVPDIVLIPGIAFNYNKFRLGRGLGYFDKYIEKHKKVKNFQQETLSHTQSNFYKVKNLINHLQKNQYPLFLGICYEFQLVKDLPLEPHDQSVDIVINEKNIIL